MANATWKEEAFWLALPNCNSSPRNDGEITEAEAIAAWTRPDHCTLFRSLTFLSLIHNKLSVVCALLHQPAIKKMPLWMRPQANLMEAVQIHFQVYHVDCQG